MNKLLLAPILFLGACGKTVAPLEVQVQTVYVPTPAPCPETKVSNDLLKSRPVPLRLQPKPADASQRSAKSQAQLGKYEAEGGWADQIEAALKRCATGQ